MKRVHLSLNVDDLAAARAFYTAMLGEEPAVVRDDYLKWRSENPAINLAVQLSAEKGGVKHMGIDTDTPEELAETLAAMDGAGLPHTELQKGTCCYAESEKVWTADPAGLPWEAFHTTEIVEEFGTPFIGTVEDQKPAPATVGGCC